MIPREFTRELVQTETLVVELRDTGGRAIAGISRNLSATGIFVETAEAPPAGTEVQMFIGSASSPSALRVTAQVVHVEETSGFGARFLDASEEARECVSGFMNRFRKR